ncbi:MULTISPECIES: TadE/TadG family type IV pilus assembly protein [unclassified Actinomadura]|uniref:TadE/TadG family type IV pilus assembly protein n=1 Tax=unclassified Actinomadura TaxID=2626254 RepID=UPI001356C8AD|nr:TadE/TadG family type IV pilus assembly protein [Actinomadura sp. K4S16]
MRGHRDADRRRGARRVDRGAAAVEFAAVLPLALMIIFLAFQAYMASTTVERVENAARTGAREASKRMDAGSCEKWAQDAMPYWLNDYSISGGPTTVNDGDAVSCRVKAQVPVIWKGIPLDFGVTRTVTMPLG